MIENTDFTVSTLSLIWMTLVVFFIHDLEEIIWVEPFLKKNRNKVIGRLPDKLALKLEHILTITSSQFSVAVLIEFIVLAVVTFSAAEFGYYLLFLSFVTIFLLHVFTHLAQSLLFRMYTPGVVSAVLLVLPFTVYMLLRLTQESLVTWKQVFLSIPLGLFIIPLVVFGHKVGRILVPK